MAVRPEDPEVTDPRLRDAAGLIKRLPAEAPPSSLAAQVVAQVRPLAVRRRRIMLGVIVALVVAGLVWAVMFYTVLSESEALVAP